MDRGQDQNNLGKSAVLRIYRCICLYFPFYNPFALSYIRQHCHRDCRKYSKF